MKSRNYAIILSICVSIIVNISNIFLTLTIRNLIDEPQMRLLFNLALFLLLSSIPVIIKNYFLFLYYKSDECSYKSQLLKTIFEFPYQLIETKKYHDDYNKIKDKTVQTQNLINIIECIISAIVGIAGVYILIVKYIPFGAVMILSCFLIITVLGLSAINTKFSVLMYDFWEQYIKNTRKYNYVSDVLSKKDYVEERKTYKYLQYFLGEFETEFDIASDLNRNLGKKRIKLELINDIVFLLCILFVFIFLFYHFINNKISLGTFITFIGYFISLINNIFMATGTNEKIIQYRKYTKDCLCFFKQAVNKPLNKNRIKNTTDYSLVLDNIIFKYPTNDTVTLKNISYNFEYGKKYAIVGVNGSGKTTLAKIIAGLYYPNSGKVYCNSNPCVLFQDFNRYPATIRENITLDIDKVPDKERINYIERISGLNNVINRMKLKDKTELTTLKQDGQDLSGGEWQRIALARTLWHNSDIYILDEPTASLDPIEEIRIFKAYNEALKDKTIIYITHRLGFVKNVDEIIVLKDGSIIETGTHCELCKTDGMYKKMFEEQKHWYEE